MNRRLVILTEIISPYRIPLFNAIARQEGIDSHVIFLSETDPNLRQWQVYKEEIRFSYQVLSSWRRRIGKYNALLNRGLGSALRSASPACILCGGYNYLASWQALQWARAHDVPFLLWSESNLQDRRAGHAVVEFLKAQFLQRCRGFVVPGKSAAENLRAQNVPPERIFTAPNAVDNDLFAGGAEAARQNAATYRMKFGLPPRYFLFVGRLVREKGVFDLLAAYAKLDAEARKNVGLVFVGDGVARPGLFKQALTISPGMIKFTGFAQRERLAVYYALADVMILPTYTDPWGLVVNEAMACGLPIVVSRAAGCAADLVVDGWNGILVPPGDVLLLCAAMQSLAGQPDLGETMGARSKQHILQHSAQSWSSGVAGAVEATGGARG
jgi:glycosyltransferase involved in cell wall biosynthesis